MIRTAPFWQARCFCGHESRFIGPIVGVYEPDDVQRLTCSRCGALFVFRNEFHHVETDGVPFYAFRQLDHDPEVPAVGRYR